jgi:hypothetical protein
VPVAIMQVNFANLSETLKQPKFLRFAISTINGGG